MKSPVFILLILTGLVLPAAGAPASGNPAVENGDWPQYRADAGRSGQTPELLPDELSLVWKYEQEPPSPAWRAINTRMDFDYAPQPVIGGGLLFFGSSSDCRVYALDAVTGREVWSHCTDAPVRFAPALWKDRLFAAGDDGYLYCLSARDGRLLWKKRGGPEGGMVLGNDRMISRHPLRGGPVVHRDVLYYGAGIWPSEGIYIRALDLTTGKERWVNDDSGGMEWDQPHPTARAKSGISAQGYLVAAGDKLIVPTGRAIPAALNLSDGSFSYFHLQEYRNYGGSRVSANDRCFFAVGGNTRFERETIGPVNAFFNLRTGKLETSDQLSSPAMAFTPTRLFSYDPRNHHVNAHRFDGLFVEKAGADGKGEPEKRNFLAKPEWSLDIRQPDAVTMIVAGNTLAIGSANRKITLVDATRRAVAWTGEVDGVPYGLAAAHGHLYVSTDAGSIYCFNGGNTARPAIIRKTPDNNPYGPNELYARAAEEIIASSGITEGYCLDLGCGNGGLAYELARRTNLKIYALDPDPANVSTARQRLSAAGLYGTRVTVHQGDPAHTGYPGYFANLIVSGRSASGETYRPPLSEIARLQRPWGGVVITGVPGAMEKQVRGPLAGSGEWTHQYHDPANTITSGDEIVRGPLGILWFRDPDFETPSRHGRNASPLFSKGRMFVQGNDGVRAYDAYNGRALWEYTLEGLMKPYDQEHLTGTAATGANWCTDGDRVFLHHNGAMTHNGARS
ncbi:MAG: outer membrane protein assembly factor BamB family protein, partial [Candidatus Latescibacterota bacterium]